MVKRRLEPSESSGGRPNESMQSQDWPLIQLREVTKTYAGPTGGLAVLQHIDLQVARGEFVAISGKSGSGKSTLLNMITGIDRPTAGEIWIGGKAIHLLNENQKAVWRGHNLGIVFQFFQLLPTLTVVENVMLPMDFCNLYTSRGRERRAFSLLEEVGMVAHARKLPSSLSGGEQQRVAIARALANNPPILVADEPTGNLDSKTSRAVFELLQGLVVLGKTIVMVTHDLDLAQRVPRMIQLADGKIIRDAIDGQQNGERGREGSPKEKQGASPLA